MGHCITCGQLVREHREKKKLTIEQLAELCNVSDRCISNIERDISLPKADTLVMICRALEIDIGELEAITLETRYERYGIHLSVRGATPVQ